MKVTSGRIMMRIAMDEYQIWKTNIRKASFTLAVIGPVIQKAVVSERMLKTVIVRSDYKPRFRRFLKILGQYLDPVITPTIDSSTDE